MTGGCTGSGSGRCLTALSKYMYDTDLRADVTDAQNVKSYYIGFGSDFAGHIEHGLPAAAERRLRRVVVRPTRPTTTPA